MRTVSEVPTDDKVLSEIRWFFVENYKSQKIPARGLKIEILYVFI